MNQHFQANNAESQQGLPFRIRAHHLLCVQGYQGYGYDSLFTANLTRIRQLFDKAPQSWTKVVAANDIVCACCPHAGEHGCEKDQTAAARIRTMDLTILDRLNLIEGANQRIGALLTLVNTTFKTRSRLQGICDNCRWQAQCLWFQKLETD